MTDNRTTELLPCPFCGGNAKLTTWAPTAVSISCIMCGAHFNTYTKEEAIAAWNTRDERTCHDANIGGLFVCSECGANMKDTYVGRSYIDDWGKRWYSTSNDHAFNYCPNCGCKVVDE